MKSKIKGNKIKIRYGKTKEEMLDLIQNCSGIELTNGLENCFQDIRNAHDEKNDKIFDRISKVGEELNSNLKEWRSIVDENIQIEKVLATFENSNLCGYTAKISKVKLKTVRNIEDRICKFKPSIDVILLDIDVVNGKFPELLSPNCDLSSEEIKNKYTLNQVLTALGIREYGKNNFNINNFMYMLCDNYVTDELQKVKAFKNYILNIKMIEMIDLKTMDYVPFSNPTITLNGTVTNVIYFAYGRIPYSRIKMVLMCEYVNLTPKMELEENKNPLFPRNEDVYIKSQNNKITTNVNHLTSNTYNNNVTNLEHVSSSTNARHASRKESRYNKFIVNYKTKMVNKICYTRQGLAPTLRSLKIPEYEGKDLCFFDELAYKIITGKIKVQGLTIKAEREEMPSITKAVKSGLYYVGIFKADTEELVNVCTSIDEYKSYLGDIGGIKPETVGRRTDNFKNGEIYYIYGHIILLIPVKFVWER